MCDPQANSGRGRAFAILPLVFLVLTVAVVVVAGNFLLSKPLTRSQAANAVKKILDSEEPITLSFHTGLVRDRLNESARDPEYRLLEKAGVVRIVTQVTTLRPKLASRRKGNTLWSRSSELESQERLVAPRPMLCHWR
jgi:hypothetical protein